MKPSEAIDVLLVEDNAHDAELVHRALRHRGAACRLVHVHDGQEALDWLFGAGRFAGRDIRRQPQTVLLDLRLPNVDGLEVLRAIRADASTAALPVVLLTTSPDEQQWIESRRCGASSYLEKPVHPENLSAALAGTAPPLPLVA